MTNPAKLRTALCTTTAIAAALLFAAPAAAQNLPDTGNVTTVTTGLNGGVPGSTTPTFSTSGAPGAQTLRVDLRDNRTILNWGGTGFDIAAGHTVDFKDSRATSGVTGRTDNIGVLNRDLSGGASQISGTLRSDANVSVYVINTNGVMFGGGAAVNTGAFLASSIDMTDADFLDGDAQRSFSGSVNSSALIQVSGGASIQASGNGTGTGDRTGDVVLISPVLRLQAAASLNAPNGDVAMIAAADVSVQNTPGSPLSFVIGAGPRITETTLIDSAGSISGGNVTLVTSKTAGNNIGHAINLSGTIAATGVRATDRGVVLTAGVQATGVAFNPGATNGMGGSMIQNAAVTSTKGLILRTTASFGSIDMNGTLTATGTLDIDGEYFNGFTTGNSITGANVFLPSRFGSAGKVTATLGSITVVDSGGAGSVGFAGGAEAALDITASVSDFNVGSAGLIAGRDILLGIAADASFQGNVQAGRDFIIQDNPSVFSRYGFTGTVSADRDLRISNHGRVTGTSFTALGMLYLRGDVGLVASTVSGGTGVTLISDGNGIPNSGVISGVAQIGSATATGTNADLLLRALSVSAYNGTGSLGALSAGRDITVNITGTGSSYDLTSVIAGRNVDVTAYAFRATRIEGTTGYARVNTTNGITIGTFVGGTSASATGTNVDITAVSVTAGNLVLTATDGGIFLGNSATGAGGVTASGNIILTGTAGVTIRTSVTAGGDLTASAGTLTISNGAVPITVKAAGALTLTSTSGQIVIPATGVTLQSNSDGVGSEALTLNAATTVNFHPGTTLLGGTARQSDVQIRNPNNSFVNIGSVTARSLLGATGTDPFTNGITRNAQVLLRGQVNLTNALYVSGTSVTINNVTVSSGNIDIRSGAALTLAGALNASGDVNVQLSSGNLTIGAAGSASGANVVLSTPGAFINNAGAAAVTANGGRWTIYSADPAGNTFGGLDSNNTARWGATIATLPPADTGPGNRYVFSIQPTLTVSAVNYTKVYGTDLNFPASLAQLYTVTGFHPGVTGAFRGDTAGGSLSGELIVTSNGLAMRASVAGGPYPITLSPGTLASPTGYALSFSNAPASITVTARPLTISYTANSKWYDGSFGGTGTVTIDGIVAGDIVTSSGTTWTFDNKNAGTGRTVTIAGTTLSGDLANYSFTIPATTTLTADIRRAQISPRYVIDRKTYDGTVAATGIISLIGVVSGETVTLNGGTLEFASKNAGGSIAVFLRGTVTLGGADAANYEFTLGEPGRGTIDPKTITGSFTANSRTYDGTTTATGTVTLNGLIAGDTVGTTGSVFTFDNRNAGTGKTVTLSGTTLTGADANNYSLAPITGTVLADIFKKALTGSVTANDRTYDGTTAATGTVTLNGVVVGDTVGTTGSVFTFDNRNAGAGKTVTVTGTTLTGADAANYTLSVGTGLAEIFKKALTGTVTADSKTYDGTTSGTGSVSLIGVVSGDTVGTGGTVFTFDNRNAGTGKTVTVSGTSLTGADAGNYSLALPASVLADIFKKALTGTVAANNRTYDGTTAATGTVTLNGVVAGDTVGTTGSVFTFDNRNAGAGKAVTVTGTSLTGADAANYTLSVGTGLAEIFKKALTGTVTANSRTYDGTTAATGSVSLGGVVAGDTVGTTGSVFTFDNRNAGTGKTVTVSGTTLTGADAGNYTVTVGTGLADIFRKALTGTYSVNSKTYDGNTNATGTVTLNGVVSGDNVGTTGTVFTFADRNAGTGKAVNVSGTTSLTGADAGNYTLTPLSGNAVGDILKKALTLGVVINGRTYDGTTGATGTVTLNGTVAGDTVAVNGVALAFADKNAGTGKAVNVTGGTLSGADAGNYSLTLPTNVVGDIFKLAITGTVTVNNKTYDGNTAGTGTVTLHGVLAGDSVGTTGTAFTFDSRNAGTGRTVTISGTTLNGADGGNYTVTLPASALADILKRSITGTVTITARQYDGTTGATGTVSLNGVVAGDTVTTSGSVFTFADRNAGTGKTVTVTGTALGGADAGNYTLTMPATALGDILQRQVAVKADDKEKDRNDDDPMLTFTITSGSLVSGDAFAGGLVRAPGEAPGSYAITIGSLSLGGNYSLTFSPGVLTIVIDPAEGQQQVLKAIPLPSQLGAPAASGTQVEIDKDALCGDDAGCVVK